ncbi:MULTISPECIES: class I SAM-dependent methyltransferase [unclassified Streptomyces]|uniref:class I SAM-dependent methyltransferase n=1 Tax=unclassified Streptomyces TaxID=2593676 RepID=UPI002E2190A6|nr:class I SAM-dependent methyltransferase [Streptomyces sp. NBC_01023]
MSVRMREGYEGTGPGARTPDGCSVELYKRLPVGDEPDVVAEAVPAGASVLELGSGAGRVTRPLAERGFTVTAVDESPGMLEQIEGVDRVRTVCSPIEKLDTGETYDVVMLASFLVHAGDPRVRQGLLRTCRRHVKDDGCVLVQREGLDWHADVPRERRNSAGGIVRITSATPVGDGVDAMVCEYVYPDATWTQTFLSRPLSREEFERHLGEAGLVVDRYLTDDGTWVRALPAQ